VTVKIEKSLLPVYHGKCPLLKTRRETAKSLPVSKAKDGVRVFAK